MTHYDEYMVWRRQGFRAVTALIMVKYGLFAVLESIGEL